MPAYDGHRHSVKGGLSMIRTAFILVALMAMPAAFAGDPAKPVIMIGDATMAQDGTITINLRRTADGINVTGRLKYAPDDRDYRQVLDHIGGMKPGETKLVPAWPDNN
jgi:hypothetical protein